MEPLGLNLNENSTLYIIPDSILGVWWVTGRGSMGVFALAGVMGGGGGFPCVRYSGGVLLGFLLVLIGV